MKPSAQQFNIRAEYIHGVAEVCQRFLGALLLLEPGVFNEAVRGLTTDAPTACSTAEALTGWMLLKDGILQGANSFHACFHRYIGKGSSHFERPALVCPSTFERDQPFAHVTEWAAAYTREFDEMHAWPPAIKAAQLLRAQPDKDWYVDELAQAVRVSRSTLERSFDRVYGLSPLRYHSLARLRAVAMTIRSDSVCIEGVIVQAGARSPKDAYRHFRDLTGKRFGDVRNMTDTEFTSLMDNLLALPQPRGGMSARA
jgi:AraC-like DNA-binding protein